MMSINNYSAVYTTQRDVQDKRPFCCFPKKATGPRARKRSFRRIYTNQEYSRKRHEQIVPKLDIPVF